MFLLVIGSWGTETAVLCEMQCRFCGEDLGSLDQLQLHYLVCTSAYAGKDCRV